MKKTATPASKTELAEAGSSAESAISTPERTPEQWATLEERAAKADETWDRLLRTTADFENFKKRAARERIEAAQSASAALLQKLLPVLDHFEMAQTAAQTAEADRKHRLPAGRRRHDPAAAEKRPRRNRPGGN